jgi:hypothetical protein
MLNMDLYKKCSAITRLRPHRALTSPKITVSEHLVDNRHRGRQRCDSDRVSTKDAIQTCTLQARAREEVEL